MAGYATFGEIKTSIAFRAGKPSLSNLGAQHETELDNCVNSCLRTIHNETRNRFLRRRKNYRLAPMVEKTTGGAILNGSTSLSDSTQSQSFADTSLGATVLLNDETAPYAIVEVGSTNTACRIEPTYVGDDLTTAPFKVIHNRILFDEDVMAIVSVIDQTNDYELKSYTITEIRALIANPTNHESTTRPHGYYSDSTFKVKEGTVERQAFSIALVPMNTGQMEVSVDYYKVPSTMTALSDEPEMPPEYRHILVEGAWVKFAEVLGLRDSRLLETSKATYRQGIKSLAGRTDDESHMPEIGSYKNSKRRYQYGYRTDIEYRDISIL